MTTAKAQRKWRDKHRYVKHQLNVMAHRLIHRYLDEICERFTLRGKGEAVTYACFITKALMQRADYDTQAEKLLGDFAETYRRDRDIYTA